MLTRQSPTYPELSPLALLRDEMDRRLGSLGRYVGMEPLFGRDDSPFLPTVDVVENGKGLKVTAELPGIEEKNVEVELTEDSLLIKGEKSEEKEEKGDSFYRKERRFGSFSREVPLPWKIDTGKVEANAKFKNGVLTVKVPRPKGVAAAAKKVPVTQG